LGLRLLQAAAAFSNLGLLANPPPEPGVNVPDPGVNVGRVPPVGVPPVPWPKLGSVTPFFFRQAT
jgi:hypothetical protein